MPTQRPELLSPALLITETRATFNTIYQGLTAEFDPRGAIDKNLIFDMAHLRVEIARYRRVEAAYINIHFREALVKLLTELLRDVDEWPFEAEEDAETVAARWFTDQTVKQKILRLLGKLGLDELAIEAEAMRCSAHGIELLQRLIAALEARWHKALRTLREHRAVSVSRLRNSGEPIIEAEATEIRPRRLPSAR